MKHRLARWHAAVGILLATVSASAQDSPEPYILLQSTTDCATSAEEESLAKEIQLRVPRAFIVRGEVASAPDWRVTWAPGDDGECALTFEGPQTTSAMPLPAHAAPEELKLAASRVAWLASVSPGSSASVPDAGPEEPAAVAVGTPPLVLPVSVETPQPPEPEVPTVAEAPEAVEEPPNPKPEPDPPEPEAEKPDPVEPPPEPAAEDLETVNLKVDILPGIHLTPADLPSKHVARFSLNVLGGSTHAVSALELGFGWNHVETDVSGVQAALGANTVGGDAKGMQLALGLNSSGRMSGGALSVGANVSRSMPTGALVAVGGNFVTGDADGALAAVGVNVVGGKFRGVQAAVGANVAGSVSGVQAALGANMAGDVDGVQVATANVARDATGVQAGIVNIARTSDMSLGLVNIMYGEPLYVTAWGTSIGGVVAGLHHGSKYVRYDYLLGYDPLLAAPAWKFGLGLTGHIPFGAKLWGEGDYLAFWQVPSGEPFFKMSLLSQLRLSLGWQIAQRFAVQGGVAGSFLLTGLRNGEDLAPSYAEHGNGLPDLYAWPEVFLGVRL